MSDTDLIANPFQHSGVTSAAAVVLGAVDLKVAAAFYDRITILDAGEGTRKLPDVLGPDFEFLSERGIIDVRPYGNMGDLREEDPGRRFAEAIQTHLAATVFAGDKEKERIGEVAGNGMARLHVALASKREPSAALTPIVTARLADRGFDKGVHLDRVPVLEDDGLEDLLPMRAIATRVIFDRLPVPTRATPWEEILSFRAESDTGLYAARLRILLRRLGEQTDRRHVSDLVRSEFADFEDRLRGMKKYRRLARTQMVLPWLDMLHGMLKAVALVKPSEAAQPYVTMEKQKVELNEAERKLRSDPYYMIEHVRSRLAW
jgi:hypothetical protein